MSRVVLNPKLQGETRSVAFDFSSLLSGAETVTAGPVTASVYSGSDGLPSSIIDGGATKSGNVVTQLITAGVAGVTYELLCQATTSLGQTLQLSAYLTVIPDLP